MGSRNVGKGDLEELRPEDVLKASSLLKHRQMKS
jgi:hypothetical protein